SGLTHAGTPHLWCAGWLPSGFPVFSSAAILCGSTRSNGYPLEFKPPVHSQQPIAPSGSEFSRKYFHAAAGFLVASARFSLLSLAWNSAEHSLEQYLPFEVMG